MKKAIIFFLIFAGLHLFAQDVIIIGIAGGAGSGKTTLSNKIFNEFKEDAVVISQDSYYAPLDNLTIEEKREYNFDHPDSIDVRFFIEQLNVLKQHLCINQPLYKRGRSFEGVKEQYLKTVYPMHKQFVEPSKRFADFIVPCNEDNSVAIDFIVSNLKDYLTNRL